VVYNNITSQTCISCSCFIIHNNRCTYCVFVRQLKTYLFAQ